MENLQECQIPSLPRFSEGLADVAPQPPLQRLKRLLARPWNYGVKSWLKRLDRSLSVTRLKAGRQEAGRLAEAIGQPSVSLQAGDWVRVRSREEIEATLDRWKELKGCAFLEYMWQYCGATHRVLQVMERFLDERDYKVKKVRGVVLLEGVICRGTPVFGRCDRCCHLFWREEWLERIDGSDLH
jgi:hypothetical protein